MVREQTIIGEISVLVKFSKEAKKTIDGNNYNETIKQLKVVNVQGRRLQWRGGRLGLNHLPEMKEVKALKEKISVVRAAAQTAITAIEHLEKLAKKERKNSVEVAAIKKKESEYKKEAGKNISMMESMAITSLEEAKKEPWINPLNLGKSENKNFLWMFLRRAGYYKYLSTINEFNEFLKIRGKIELHKADLFEADLRKAHFGGAYLNLANLTGANLNGANLTNAELEGARLQVANLTNANLNGANLTGAELRGVKFYNADLTETDLTEVRNLREKTLHSANNWRGAKNVPKNLVK